MTNGTLPPRTFGDLVRLSDWALVRVVLAWLLWVCVR